MRRPLALGILLLLIGIYTPPVPNVHACSPAVAVPSPYVDLHSAVVRNGDQVGGSLLAVEVNSSLPELTLSTKNGPIKLVRQKGIYVPKREVFVERVFIRELPKNATFRVFYSGFPSLRIPPLSFSDGKFVLEEPLSIKVSRDGFYLNITHPRGFLIVFGENGVNFTFEDSKAIAGNRTFVGSPQKLDASFCTGCEGRLKFRMTGYQISLRIREGVYETHGKPVEWKPELVVLEKGFSFENLTLYDNCTELMVYLYHGNCTIKREGNRGDYEGEASTVLGIALSMLLVLAVLRWRDNR